MGREHEEDGAKTKPKHITFDQASLDGSDEDDGAVEVSAMPSICLIASGLFFWLDETLSGYWSYAFVADYFEHPRSPSTPQVHTGGKARWFRRRLLYLRRSVCSRVDKPSAWFIN